MALFLLPTTCPPAVSYAAAAAMADHGCEITGMDYVLSFTVLTAALIATSIFAHWWSPPSAATAAEFRDFSAWWEAHVRGDDAQYTAAAAAAAARNRNFHLLSTPEDPQNENSVVQDHEE